MTRRNTARGHGGRQRWSRTAAIAVLVVCGIAIAPQASFAAAPVGAGTVAAAARAGVKVKAPVHAAPGKDSGRKHKKAHHAQPTTVPSSSPSARPSASARPSPSARPSASARPRVHASTHATPRPTASSTARIHANALPTPTPRRTGYRNSLDAAGEPAPNSRLEDGQPVLTAEWTYPTIPDHQQSQLVLTLTRGDSLVIKTGLGYTITLPAGLVVADASTQNYCQGTVVATLGATSFSLSGGIMNIGSLSCLLYVKVTASSSGSYVVDSSSAGSLSSGMIDSITPQTLTVTAATPLLTSTFSPTTIDALGTSTYTMSVHRTDLNTSSTSSGIGLTGTLPAGLQIGTGAKTNTCGGTLTATTGASSFTLAGASMTGGAVTCTMTVPMKAITSGNKEMQDSSASDVTGVVARLGAATCGERGHVIEGEGCPLTLQVNALPQTITFAQPADFSVSHGTVTATATSTSGLTVTLTGTTPSVCTISGTTITLVSAGSCTVTAHQAGNDVYAAATDVPRTFTVTSPTAPPTDVTATAGVSSITAHWAAPADVTGLTGYTAIASPGPARCTTTGALTCVMGGTAGVTYTVTVVADNPAGDSVPAGPSNEVVPTAPAIADTPPSTTLDLTTDKGLITTAVPNQDIIVIGTGFAAYSTATIVIYSSPIVLGTAITDGAGDFSKPVTIPTTLDAGVHTMIAAGVDPQGAPHSLRLTVTLHATTAGTTTRLAVTGQATDLLFLLGLAAVTSGTVLLRTGRRKRTTA